MRSLAKKKKKSVSASLNKPCITLITNKNLRQEIIQQSGNSFFVNLKLVLPWDVACGIMASLGYMNISGFFMHPEQPLQTDSLFSCIQPRSCIRVNGLAPFLTLYLQLFKFTISTFSVLRNVLQQSREQFSILTWLVKYLKLHSLSKLEMKYHSATKYIYPIRQHTTEKKCLYYVSIHIKKSISNHQLRWGLYLIVK